MTTTTSAQTSPTVTATGRRRVLRATVWGVQVLLAVFFVFAAAPKLGGQKDAVESFAQIGLGQWFRYLTGTCELAGAIGLLVPRLSGLAALGLVGLMIGATITNLLVLSPATAPVTILLGVVFAAIAWHRRHQTAALVAAFRH